MQQLCQGHCFLGRGIPGISRFDGYELESGIRDFRGVGLARLAKVLMYMWSVVC